MYDPDKIAGKRIEALGSAIADLTTHIENIEDALNAAAETENALPRALRRLRARGFDAEERADARQTVTAELEELFHDFEALQQIANEHLTKEDGS